MTELDSLWIWNAQMVTPNDPNPLLTPQWKTGSGRWSSEAAHVDVTRLDDLTSQVIVLDELTAGAHTLWFAPGEVPAAEARRAVASMQAEHFAALEKDDGSVAIIDQIANPTRDTTDLGAYCSLTYPSLHARLGAWWLVQAWRAVDLHYGAVESLRDWRMGRLPTLVRTHLELAASVNREKDAIQAAWSSLKLTGASLSQTKRVLDFDEAFGAVLFDLDYSTRMKHLEDKTPRATNIQTLIKRFGKMERLSECSDWYDALSDGSHPALGARLGLVGSQSSHRTAQIQQHIVVRSPLSLGGTAIGNPLAAISGKALVAATGALVRDLKFALLLIDDIGLTTGAATYTSRQYWRNFEPQRGKRMCPCECGPWSKSGHRWGESLPVLSQQSGKYFGA